MSKESRVVSDRRAMLAGMTPRLTGGVFVFCTTADNEVAARAAGGAFALVREDEGVTLILALEDAQAHGFGDRMMPMRRILLEVYSALDGVGLTAAVAAALAAADIPCNMVAGYHHDHVFVPAALAEHALHVLQEVQKAASGAG